MTFKTIFLALLTLNLVIFTAACEEDGRANAGTGDADNVADSDSSGNSDVDSDSDTDVDGDTDDAGFDSEDCDNLLEVTFRDFQESHPDFERGADPAANYSKGWGPVAGIVDQTLGADRKPIMVSPLGSYQWSQGDPESGVLVANCPDNSDGEGKDTDSPYCYVDSDNPMFDGEESFNDWYHDTSVSKKITDIKLEMVDQADKPGVYVYDSSAFFPLGTEADKTWGVTPDDATNNPDNLNFLFTTEIHLKFIYQQGQQFTFRGDDDLWIFVNNKLAIDLGGMHEPFVGIIDFDAQAEDLGISPGAQYHMDIFHAERQTNESNFRIETNISCFVPVVVE